MQYYNFIVTGDDKPQWCDLLGSVVEQYAIHWKKIGLKLGLKDYQLANICENNGTFESGRVERCCRDMLERWLRQISLPTWGKLDDVINSLTNVPTSTGLVCKIYDISNYACILSILAIGNHSMILKDYYKTTRFNSGECTWPPDQPKHFTPVMIIYQKQQRSKEEIKNRVENGIDEYLSKTSSKTTQDLQEVFLQPLGNQYQHSILVEGLPGVGKSVLLKHIGYLWGIGELLQYTDFLFLLHLRDPSVQQIDSLDALVHHFYRHDEQASHVTSCVAQDGGKSVTILLDGYDELPVNLRQNGFIVDLLQRKILPACSIVVTSRPHASTNLRHSISCQVEILGFSQQDQQHFIEHSLKGQPHAPHKISQLKQYLKNHSAIRKLCNVPFNMNILLYLYKNKEEIPLPTNYTGLYNSFICLTICRHLAKSEIPLGKEIEDLNSLPQPYSKIMRKLSKFAFKTLGNNNQLMFTFAEVKEKFPDIHKANDLGLLQAVEYAGRTSKSLYFGFIHLSIQEFLAAHHVATLPPSKEHLILHQKFWNTPEYFNVFDIYVALTNGQRLPFKRLFQPSLVERLKTLFIGREKGSKIISDQLLNDKIKCLRMYCGFQEAGDTVKCKLIEIATKLDKQLIDLKYVRLSLNDIHCLTTFLTNSSHKEWQVLDLYSSHIQDCGLQILQHRLQNSDITFKNVELNNTDLTQVSSSFISDLTINCRVQKLWINDNKIVGEDETLYRLITDGSSVLKELYMNSVKLSPTGAILLFTALSKPNKLRVLWISDNDISDNASQSIIRAMKENTSLVEVQMYKNLISGTCACNIVQALQNNEILQRLYLDSVGPNEWEKISELQRKINKKRFHRCQVKLQVYFYFMRGI